MPGLKIANVLGIRVQVAETRDFELDKIGDQDPYFVFKNPQ